MDKKKKDGVSLSRPTIVASPMPRPPRNPLYAPPFVFFERVAVPFGPTICSPGPASRAAHEETAGSLGGGNCRKGVTEQLFREGMDPTPWKCNSEELAIVPNAAVAVS